MSYGQISFALVSFRSEASHVSEQINQLLFGDCYTVLEQTEGWLRIKSAYDDCEGWICDEHHSPITEETFNKRLTEMPPVSLDLLGRLKEKKGDSIMNVVIGSSLYFEEKNALKIDDKSYKYKGKIASQKRSNLLDYALLYLNAPYQWGGRTPLGIDCSGLVQLSHKLCGIKLPRDSYQQAEFGAEIEKLSEAKKGDLCFFGDENRINHVGILVNKKSVLHVSDKAKIEAIDDQGIADRNGNHTHFLMTIKRLLE